MKAIEINATGLQEWLFRLARKCRPKVDRLIAGRPCIGKTPFLQAETFPWTAQLEQHWPAIREEAQSLLQRQPRGETHHLRQSAMLWCYGYRVAENCRHCPQTIWHLEHIPGLQTAYFAQLEADGYAAGPRAATRRLLTCHLALNVPDDWKSCRLTVDDKTPIDDTTGEVREQSPGWIQSHSRRQWTGYWIEGKCLMFDDSYPAAARNDSDEPRLILVLQFSRPLAWPGRLIGNLLLAGLRRCPTFQAARRNPWLWDKALRDME
jgi:beta-hydroxylase